jgi:hypothetical protein
MRLALSKYSDEFKLSGTGAKPDVAFFDLT